MALKTDGLAEPVLMSWHEALGEAWRRVDEDGWRMRVWGFRSPRDGRWHYTTARAGRRRPRYR